MTIRQTVLAVPIRFCTKRRLQFCMTWPKKAAADEACNYTLPGGGVEPGEHPVTAIVRELREELGLKPRDYALRNIPHADDAFVHVTTSGTVKQYQLFLAELASAEPVAGPEVAAVDWFVPEQLLDFAEQGLTTGKQQLIGTLIPLLLEHFPETFRGQERLLREVAESVTASSQLAA